MKLLDIQPFYNGLMQRLGSKNDGGYVVPLELPQMDTLVSFGLGDDSNFELDCKRKGLVKEFLVFDHTVSIRILVLKLTRRIFSAPVNVKAIIYRFNVLCLYIYRFKVLRNKHYKNRIVAKKESRSDLTLEQIASVMVDGSFMLKVDIEGDEYQLIQQIVDLQHRIPLAVMEFHDTDSSRNVFEESIIELKKYFKIVHLHGNNFTSISDDGIPQTLEITFLNNKFIQETDKVKNLPRLGFDEPSSKDQSEIRIRFNQ